MRRIKRTRWITAGVVTTALAAALTVTALRGTVGGTDEEGMPHMHGGTGGAGGHDTHEMSEKDDERTTHSGAAHAHGMSPGATTGPTQMEGMPGMKKGDGATPQGHDERSHAD